MTLTIERFANNPIIHPDLSTTIGDNINGPSLIRVPDWVREPLGRYYLYFAHHRDSHIRLAYADQPEGPWRIHEPGVLRLEDSLFQDHIASPDVLVDHENHQVRMYYHGCIPKEEANIISDSGEDHPFWGGQRTRVALSDDGMHFSPLPELLGGSYFRVWKMNGCYYGLVMPGVIVRSEDGLTGFEIGPTLFTEHMRHSAVLLRGQTLHVFYSNAYDEPEHILHTTVDVAGEWLDWKTGKTESVIRPELDYEGAGEPLVASQRGRAAKPVHQLRDPALYEEDGEVILLYSVAGEQGIAAAHLNGL